MRVNQFCEVNMKSYLYLALIFLVCSYLSPKDEYKKYFQFMLGIFMAVIILKPLTQKQDFNLGFDQVMQQIEEISYGSEETFKTEKN